MRRKVAIAYILAFGLVIGVVGFLSIENLISFYVNDELDNNNWTADLGDKFETDIASSFYEKTSFVNLNGGVRRILGQHEMNGVVKLNNGWLVQPMDYVEDTVLRENVKKVSELNDYLENRGSNLVWAFPPFTTDKYDPELPKGVFDYSNDDLDRLISYADQEEINTIDIREEMRKDGVDHYEMMYKTDHHWTTRAGLYAYGVLEDYIVSETGCIVDAKVRDETQYTITTFPKCHLGSRGQRTGSLFAGIDDFDLIIPNFETSIRNENGTDGTVQGMMYDKSPLENKDLTSRYTYDWTLIGTLGDYTNLTPTNDIKILFISDSYAKAVEPYLVMGFSEVRYVYEFDAECITPEYIEEYDPDIVILMYYAENAIEEDAYPFQGF